MPSRDSSRCRTTAALETKNTMSWIENKLMKRNLANWERVLRVVGGVAAAGASVMLDPLWLSLTVGASGVGLAATGLVARCPVCHLGGVGSYRGCN